MLLYKTISLYNIGPSYKLLRSRIFDLTFKFFQKSANFMTCGLGLALGLVNFFFSELGLVHQELGLELGLVEISFAELGLVLGLIS